MKRLLSIELYKVKHHKLSKILFIAYFALLSSIALIASIKFTIGHTTIYLADQGIFNFPYIWHFNTYTADFFTFFLAIIVVSMVTNEFGYRTVKQNLIDGMTKKEFVLSKFTFLVVLSLLATAFVAIITLVLGWFYSDFTSFNSIVKEIYFLPAFFLKLLGIFSFIMLTGFIFKRSAFALGFFFIWMIIEGIIYLTLRVKIDKEIAAQVTGFFPYLSIKNLLPEPATRLSFAKNIGKQIGEKIDVFNGIPIQNYIIVIFWITIFVFLSYYILKKRDL